MKRHLPLIFVLLCIACRDAPTSPSASPLPSATPQSPAGPVVTTRGEVMDSRNLPIPGAQVQVVTGSAVNAVAETDEDGRFVLPWTFTSAATVRVTKQGFHARERRVPEPGAPRPPAFLRFDLEAIDGPIVVAGTYQMTLTAASECTQLPSVAQQRTYRSHVFATSTVGWFTAALDGDFPYTKLLSLEVRRDSPQTVRVHILAEADWTNPGIGLVERIRPDLLLEFSGSADLPLGAQSASAAFDGTFSVCAAEPVSPVQVAYCPLAPVTCRSANHRLVWTRQ